MNPTVNPMVSFATDPEGTIQSYLKLGYHVEPDLWTPEECQALIEASHALPSYKSGDYTPVMQVHRIAPVFLLALANPRIVKIMERLVSGQVSGLQTEFFFCRPGVRGFSAHQDNVWLGAKPDAFATAWSALEDAGPENGGLIVYPGTHCLPVLPVRQIEGAPVSVDQDPNAHRNEVVVPPGYEAVPLVVPMSSVVFLHANIVHSSNNNRTKDRYRHVLVATYLRRGEAFRPGSYARRSEVDVYNVSL